MGGSFSGIGGKLVLSYALGYLPTRGFLLTPYLKATWAFSRRVWHGAELANRKGLSDSLDNAAVKKPLEHRCESMEGMLKFAQCVSLEKYHSSEVVQGVSMCIAMTDQGCLSATAVLKGIFTIIMVINLEIKLQTHWYFIIFFMSEVLPIKVKNINVIFDEKQKLWCV